MKGFGNQLVSTIVQDIIDGHVHVDNNGNLPSPDEFWEVAKGIMNDKPISIPMFGKVIRINGDDVEEIKNNFSSIKK